MRRRAPRRRKSITRASQRSAATTTKEPLPSRHSGRRRAWGGHVARAGHPRPLKMNISGTCHSLSKVGHFTRGPCCFRIPRRPAREPCQVSRVCSARTYVCCVCALCSRDTDYRILDHRGSRGAKIGRALWVWPIRLHWGHMRCAMGQSGGTEERASSTLLSVLSTERTVLCTEYTVQYRVHTVKI